MWTFDFLDIFGVHQFCDIKGFHCSDLDIVQYSVVVNVPELLLLTVGIGPIYIYTFDGQLCKPSSYSSGRVIER